MSAALQDDPSLAKRPRAAAASKMRTSWAPRFRY